MTTPSGHRRRFMIVLRTVWAVRVRSVLRQPGAREGDVGGAEIPSQRDELHALVRLLVVQDAVLGQEQDQLAEGDKPVRSARECRSLPGWVEVMRSLPVGGPGQAAGDQER